MQGEKMGNEYDWQKTKARKMRWPYTGDINNKKYLADRSKLFKESGNGWWMLQGTCLGKTIGND